MSKSIRFVETVKKIASPQVHKYGYKIITPWKGSSSVFFQKNIYQDYYGFIQFSRSPLVIPIPGNTTSRRSFQVYLLRNKGEKPVGLLINPEDKFELSMTLCYLFWDILNITKYNSRYYEWDYHNQSQLEVQINRVIDDLVQYGIPWLEDINSRNPY